MTNDQLLNSHHPKNQLPVEGILLVDKPKGPSSFKLVQILRKRLGVKKIGHAGTLDPNASGVMVMLVGRNYTRLSNDYLCKDKEYAAEIRLGIETDTYDSEGTVVATSALIPTLAEVEEALKFCQGEISQIPPMYSAKKVQGKKLYELARKGIEVKREPAFVTLQTELICYAYPLIELLITCSKGTYIRSIAQDIGIRLQCGAHLSNLKRTRSGTFCLKDCISGEDLLSLEFPLKQKLINRPLG